MTRQNLRSKSNSTNKLKSPNTDLYLFYKLTDHELQVNSSEPQKMMITQFNGSSIRNAKNDGILEMFRTTFERLK